MPRASQESASENVTVEGYEGHFEHFDGGYTVGFETYTADADMAPMFKGLPDDRCQCPHWGYVVRGRVKYTTTDGQEETYEAGEAYYVPPGHTPSIYAGTEVVEFSPTEELAKTMEVVQKNMEATGE
jgi:Cupin domain